MSTPQSIINICTGVRLDSRYEHTIYFEAPEDQRNYFGGKTVKVFPSYSYLRKSWPLKVAATMEEAKTWNYLFFKNTTDGKTYYYFINTVEYINDSTVELGLELDVMQTYHFDYSLRPCFVERQHVDDDTIGLHTVDEGLELGEFIDNSHYDLDPGDLAIMIMATINPNAETVGGAHAALPYSYNGVFSGVKFWAVDGSQWVKWGEQLKTLDELGQSGAILSMWMYPKSLIVLGGDATWADPTELCKPVEKAIGLADRMGSTGNLADTVQKMTPGTPVNGYIPKNNKVLIYPFNFLYVTNNQGGSAAYRYERFGSGGGFYMTGALSPDGGVRLTPSNYNGQGVNYENGLTITSYPTCAWDTDVYKMWLAQNQNTHNLTMATGALKVGAGIVGAVATSFTGVGALAGAGTAISGAMEIANHLAQKADRAIEPPQAKGNFSAAINVTDKKQCFTVTRRSVNAEHAAIIDDYFTMYGYKLNSVTIPLQMARELFTYVKTIGCVISPTRMGSNQTFGMCNEDRIKIEGIYDRGITFWADGDKIGDYYESNEPVYKG